MELYLKAQRSSMFDHAEKADTRKGMVGAGKFDRLLAPTRFWTRVRATQKRGELMATGVIMLCGGVLAGMMFVVNTSDRVGSWLRR
jgi:hypothetical protein